MKKFLSLTLVLTLLLTCVACGKSEPVNTDSSTTTESNTESTTENTTVDDTTTESVSEGEKTKVVEEGTTKAQSEEETTKKNNTTTKPETTTKKTETTTKKPSANTTTTTTKPTTTEKKPYFVSFEVVSIQRAENYKVDGMHVLDRIYGKNQCFQYGDTVKIRVNMSDGGNGFSVYEKDGCTVSVSGNIITAKITGHYGTGFFLQIKTTDKNGNSTTPYCEYKIWNWDKISDSDVIREYAKVKGLTLLNGSNAEPHKRYVIDIPGNSNWMSQALDAIDNARSIGCKKYTYQIVYQGAFAMSVYK